MPRILQRRGRGLLIGSPPKCGTWVALLHSSPQPPPASSHFPPLPARVLTKVRAQQAVEQHAGSGQGKRRVQLSRNWERQRHRHTLGKESARKRCAHTGGQLWGHVRECVKRGGGQAQG
eukprot:358707-Chlamydomonas_euryale.AAC.2